MGLTLAEFNALVEEHGPALYRTALRMMGDRHEAEDQVQEAFRSAWKSRERFEPENNPRAWLVSILRRRVIDFWRRPRPAAAADTSGALEPGVEAEDPLAQQYTDEMQKALDQLPAPLREALLMVVVAELTHQEVADVLEIPLGTVLSRVSRARERMRQLLMSAARTA